MGIVRGALKALDDRPGGKLCIPCWAMAAGFTSDHDELALSALANLSPDIAVGEGTCAICGKRTKVVSMAPRPPGA